MKKPEDVVRIAGEITTTLGRVLVGVDAAARRCYLQIEGAGGRGRKWWLSQHMTKSEVVRTAFMACLAYAEHETREGFRYNGACVFGPHIDVDRLASIAHLEDRRREAPGAWEREDGA